MVNPQATFLSQFFYISVAEGITAVPPHTPEDNHGQEMTPLEQASFGHTRSDSTDKNLLPYHQACFLQQNQNEAV